MIVGLTGNIASGKSTVLAYMRQKGAYIIDADKLAHQAMAPGGLAYQPIIDAFGRDFLRADGTIDRSALGRVIFGDPAALQQLEQIVHPAVFALAKAELAQTTAPVIIVEAIKLLESSRLRTLCQEVWVVTADPAVQLRRLRQDRCMSEAESRQRMAAQPPQSEKIVRATRVITNNGSREELHAALDQAWNELLAAA
jgi:dephospho-CoA kinase